MRFNTHLKEEWSYQEGFAGRGIIRSIDSSFVIVWQYIDTPTKLGLLWTMPNGTTYLNGRKIGTVNVKSSSSTSHKQILAQLYNELGFDELNGELRSNVERWHEQNARGRIIKDKIYAYEDDSKMSKKINVALSAIRKYIKTDWFVGLNEAKKRVSSALFLTDGGVFLAVRPTFQNHWDIPKGLQDAGENPLDTLVREVEEETGFNIRPYKSKITRIGRYHYLSDKDIEVFYLKLDELPNILQMKCVSMFEPKYKGKKLGIEAPEVSAYSYFENKDIGKLKPGIRQIVGDVIRRTR